MKDYAKTDGSSSLPGDQALPPGSPAVVLPDGQVIPPSPSLASTLIRSNSASPFQPALVSKFMNGRYPTKRCCLMVETYAGY